MSALQTAAVGLCVAILLFSLTGIVSDWASCRADHHGVLYCTLFGR